MENLEKILDLFIEKIDRICPINLVSKNDEDFKLHWKGFFKED